MRNISGLCEHGFNRICEFTCKPNLGVMTMEQTLKVVTLCNHCGDLVVKSETGVPEEGQRGCAFSYNFGDRGFAQKIIFAQAFLNFARKGIQHLKIMAVFLTIEEPSSPISTSKNYNRWECASD